MEFSFRDRRKDGREAISEDVEKIHKSNVACAQARAEEWKQELVAAAEAQKAEKWYRESDPASVSKQPSFSGVN